MSGFGGVITCEIHSGGYGGLGFLWVGDGGWNERVPDGVGNWEGFAEGYEWVVRSGLRRSISGTR